MYALDVYFFLFQQMRVGEWSENGERLTAIAFFVLGKEKRKRNALFYTMDIVSNRLIQLSNRF